MIRSDGIPFSRIAAMRRPPLASIGMETGNPNGRKNCPWHIMRLRLHSPRRAASKANGPSTALSSSAGTTARTTGTVSTTPPRSVARKLQPAMLTAIDNSDDDLNGDEDEFVDASDPEGDGNGGKSAKAKGKHKVTTQGGKNPKQARHNQ